MAQKTQQCTTPLRIPESLKEWAKREAKAQGQRSLNSWINAMLEQRRAEQANA
jgi:predicted HicB family RNase H-like nuclease